jgi:hypothetical protein
VFQIEVAAGRARIFRVDVQVGVKAHCGHAWFARWRVRANLRLTPIRRKIICGRAAASRASV